MHKQSQFTLGSPLVEDGGSLLSSEARLGIFAEIIRMFWQASRCFIGKKSSFPTVYVIGMLAVGFEVPKVLGADWLQFRGPGGSGVASESVAAVKLDSSKHISWTSSLPGRGLSSPIVIGEKVVVTSSSGAKQDRLHVLCYSSKDGALLWERQFWATGRTMCHEKTSVAASSPVSDGRYMYALYSSNDLVCLDLEGNLVWLRGLMRDYPNASNSLGMSSSLIIADGVLVAVIENDSESFTVGLDAELGMNLWKLSRPKKANWTSPVLLPGGGEKVLVGLQSSAGLSAVDAKTGREVWAYKEGASTIPSSAVSGDVLYVPSHGLTALKMSVDGGAPQQIWRSSQLRPATPSPIVVGNGVITMNDAGVVSCGDKTTGTRLWQLRLKGPFSASPVAAGTTLFAVNEAGVLYVIDVSKPEGELVSELDLKQTVLSTPSISAGAIYVRSDSKLWKIGPTLTL